MAASLPGTLAAVHGWRNHLNKWVFLVAILLISAAVVSRRPDLISNPQFWGDESSWFAEAYSTGAFHSLFHPQAGYLCVASKIPDVIATHVPLVEAPEVFDLYTIAIQALLASFLLTSRLAHLASLPIRTLLCFLWIAVPNCAEIETLNNTQWMLAVLGALVLLSAAPKTLPWKIFDVVSIALISVTGPFCLLLFPIACILWIIRRSRWTAVLTPIVGLGCCAQLFTLSHFLKACTPVHVLTPLGIRVLAGQVFLFGTMDGGNIIPHASLQSLGAAELATVIVIAGVLMGAYALVKAPLELKLFVAFGGLVCLAVIRRLHCDRGWDWQSMMNIFYAVRYWYIPRLAVLAIFVWLLGRARPLWIRAFGYAAVLSLSIAAVAHWQYPAQPNLDFPRYARAFNQVPPGTTVTIPVNPGGWTLTLVKH